MFIKLRCGSRIKKFGNHCSNQLSEIFAIAFKKYDNYTFWYYACVLVILVKYGKYIKNFREIVFVFDDCGKKDEPPLLSDGKLRGLDLLMFF